MKTTLALASLLSAAALTAAAGTCCDKAAAEGKTCGHCAPKAEAGCPAKGACGAKAAATADAAAPKAAYGTVDTAALQKLLASGTALVLLDARTGKWDDGQRLPGAKALAPDATAEQAAAAVPAKDSLVVTYCSNTKCPASAKLAERLVELGYTNVLKYPDGIQAWTAAGNKVEAAAP